MASYTRVQDVDHEIGPDGRFLLRVTSPEVEIRAVDGPVARVRIEFEIWASSDEQAEEAFTRSQYRVHRADGVLEISEPKGATGGLEAIGRLFGGGYRTEARVIAEVPRRAAVSYTGVSSDLTASGLLGSQEYRTVSGDLVLNDIGGPISINGVSSDVTLRATSPIRLAANTVSGDLSALAPRIEETRIVTVSGDVELEGQLEHSGSHRIETVSGDLSLGAVGGMTLEVRGLSTDVNVSLAHRSEGTRDRRRYVIGDGAASVLFSSMSGDAFVHGARRSGSPTPPTPAAPPAPPVPAAAQRTPPSEAEQLAILRALERGEIDVEEASRRLAGGDRGA